ncbi:RNA polymerase sigma-70 factor [Pedobacter hiemivivus]|uniref:RNA polymerase sigma-70 factor n=1 Tax=Pedobacter hiemivivus TaxID=2530454 RepID=A0A4V6N5N1_9SPHI|nr:RNA polymerase sigma-70 factor [Pedobacter hiemivivus]TCC87876.1 RNA polymerase sigma-70 factor [Pedobacter hiemivivus]
MGLYSNLTDQELSGLLKSGNPTVFAEIYNRYKAVLYLHAYRMIQNREEAKDVVQELFAAIWANHEKLIIKTTLSAYLYGAIRNRILDVIAHQKIVLKYTDTLQSFLEAGESVTDDQIREKELTAIIETEISLMPPKMREVFELSRQQDLSHKQIAAQLNISDKTVKKQVSKAIKLLRLKINLLLTFF